MAAKSYWACILSLELLKRLSGNPPKGFLWTLTFADPEAQKNPREAANLFRPLRLKMQQDGKVFLRTMEAGARNGNWHYHLVTFQRWDFHALRSLVVSYGFGMVLDVREKETDQLAYVAKYVAKNIGYHSSPLASYVRRWGCVGFEGVSCRNVKVTKRVLHLVKNTFERLYDWCEWRLDGELLIRQKLRETSLNPLEPSYTKMNELTSAQVKRVSTCAAQGVPCILGEYRVCDVEIKNVKDSKTGVSTPRVLVQHTVETAKQALVVSEWLPVGADPKAVKAPAAKGDIVIVEIYSMSTKFGATRLGGTIFKL